MQKSSYAVDILVNNKSITEHAHEGKIYVEGRKGSDYKIRVKNNSGSRILAVISVDGLSVLDGKPAGSLDNGYVLSAYQELIIPGWTLDNNEVAKFVFSSNDESYSEKSGNGTKNVGVIGVKIFKEKVEPQVICRNYPDPYYPKRPNSPYWDGFHSRNYSSEDSLLERMTCSNSVASSGILRSSVSESATVSTPEEKPLGTGFGKATEFKTVSTSFTRDGNAETFLIYYDSKKGLEARGIKFTKKAKVKEEPEAFPGDTGCKPPEGWVR